MRRLLDLYCGAGGTSRGYQRAGFHVTGVDIKKPSYYGGDEFVHGDALEYLEEHGSEYDVIHASPPCQAYSHCQRLRSYDHPELIAPTRDMLKECGKPYIIENVENALLKNPVTLCGCMFPELRTYRARDFECSFRLRQPPHERHVSKVAKMGRKPEPGEFMHVVGNFSGVKEAHIAMRIGWMTRRELVEAIPPAYTEYVGKEMIANGIT